MSANNSISGDARMVDKNVVMAYMNIKSMQFTCKARPAGAGAATEESGTIDRRTRRSGVDVFKLKRQLSASSSCLDLPLNDCKQEAGETEQHETIEEEPQNRRESDQSVKLTHKYPENEKRKCTPDATLKEQDTSQQGETDSELRDRVTFPVVSRTISINQSPLNLASGCGDWENCDYDTMSQLIERRCTDGVPHGQFIPIIVVLSTFMY